MKIKIRRCSEQDIELLLPLIEAYHEFESIKTSAEHREAAVQQLLADQKLGSIWLITNQK